MTTTTVLILTFAFILGGVPLGFAMTAMGFIGVWTILGLDQSRFMVSQVVFGTSMSYAFSVLPLFLLMGNFIAKSKLADELFAAAYAFIGHRRGGLARATIVACGGLSAVCGSSVATAATMVNVALPAMRQYGYDVRLATGAIAVGGTLGILIPPSTVFLLYGLMTQTEIAELFAAGIVPGLIAIVLYNVTIDIITRIRPEYGPVGKRSDWVNRLAALRKVWAVAALFILIMGGFIAGIFTASEGGGIGAAGAFLFALYRRVLTWRIIVNVLLETGRTTAMLFTILFGALLFANYVELTGLPAQLGTFVEGLHLGPIGVMLLIIAIYLGLGCVLESLSMMFLTVPLFFPIIKQAGFHPVWFGVILVVVMEFALISPPVGMNVFVIKSMVPDVSLGTVFAGVTPFMFAMIVLLAILLFFPTVALFLPKMLF